MCDHHTKLRNTGGDRAKLNIYEEIWFGSNEKFEFERSPRNTLCTLLLLSKTKMLAL